MCKHKSKAASWQTFDVDKALGTPYQRVGAGCSEEDLLDIQAEGVRTILGPPT